MIVVTGGAGFIGSNIVAELEDAGVEAPVVVADLVGLEDKWRNLSKRKNIQYIIRPDELFRFLNQNHAKIKAIVHMGAISSTVERDADLILANNVKYSLELLEAAALTGIRIVYASSASVYGTGEGPINPYAWGKALVDRQVERLMASIQQTKIVGLRFYNVYGVNEYHKKDQASFICKAAGQVTNGAMIKLFRSTVPGVADGEQSRDFVYVKDCARLVVDLINSRQEVKGIFDVGTGRSRTFMDVATTVAFALKPDGSTRVNFIPMPDNIIGYQHFTQADTAPLRALGLGCPTSLEDGVADFVKYVSRKDFYR